MESPDKLTIKKIMKNRKRSRLNSERTVSHREESLCKFRSQQQVNFKSFKNVDESIEAAAGDSRSLPRLDIRPLNPSTLLDSYEPDDSKIGSRIFMQDEKTRLFQKISRVNNFWNRSSLMIPNVFKMARIHEEDSRYLYEYQDLSKKELMIQSNGLRANGSFER